MLKLLMKMYIELLDNDDNDVVMSTSVVCSTDNDAVLTTSVVCTICDCDELE